MSWDAFAGTKRADHHYLFGKRIWGWFIINPWHWFIFRRAEKRARRDGYGVYAGLSRGILSGSSCIDMLSCALDVECPDSAVWSADYVQEINKTADWDIQYGSCESVAYWTARHFWETCVKLKLSIEFSG